MASSFFENNKFDEYYLKNNPQIMQIEIGQSRDLKELWMNVCIALEKLKFDMGEMNIAQRLEDAPS